MLYISRAVGQSVIIGNSLKFTLNEISAEFIVLKFTDISVGGLDTVTKTIHLKLEEMKKLKFHNSLYMRYKKYSKKEVNIGILCRRDIYIERTSC